jgi:transposase
MKRDIAVVDRTFKSVGIDISKDKLDVYFLANDTWQEFTNTNTGINKLIKVLQTHSPDLVIFEPTGNYELLLLLTLSKFKFPSVMQNLDRFVTLQKLLDY